MDKGLAWASVISVAGLAGMGVVAAVVEPPLVTLDDLANRLGATVTVEGIVTSLNARAEDWTTLRLGEGNLSVEIVLEDALNASTGDRVRVTGQVGSYGGRIQLQVESATDIQVLVPWQENHIDLGVLLDKPWLYLDQHVRTSGWIEDGRLLSESTGAGLPLRGASRLEGAHVVDGVLTFDQERALFVLFVEHARPWAA